MEDLTGKTFGNWEVLEFSGWKYYPNSRVALWKCKCVINPECITDRKRQDLMNNVTPSICKECRKCMDLTGRQFGNLTVLSQAEDHVVNGCHSRMWHCRCTCGTERDFFESNLLGGKSKSCGCIRNQKTTERNRSHGLIHTRLYSIWANMRKRCMNPNDPRFHRYGGRGITICDEWNDFQVFYDWAIANGYADNLTIDRIDNDKGYFPDNCRWATNKQQSNNRISTRFITLNGETHSVTEWCEISGQDPDRVYVRLDSGWDEEKAIFSPTQKPRKVIRIDRDGNETMFESVKQAAELHGVKPATITAACNKPSRNTQGYHWKYAEVV